MAPAAINGVTTTRSYAAAAYYVAISNRSNLALLTGVDATRIVSIKGKYDDGMVTATGVEFLLDGQNRLETVKAGGEVLVSTG
jgi:hypothetical protein